MPVFAKWVQNNFEKLKDDSQREFSRIVTRQYFGGRRRYDVDYKRDFATILMNFALNEPELLNTFMSTEISLVGLKLGPRKQGVIREVFAKHTGSDCKNCKETSCIMQKQKTTFEINTSELDFKKLCEYSYTLIRISMEGRPIARARGTILGPIDISPDVTRMESFERVKFQFNAVAPS